MIERGDIYIYISYQYIYIYVSDMVIDTCVCVCVWHCMPKSYLLCIQTHTYIYIYTYNMQPFCCPRSRGDIPFFWTQGCSHTGWHHRTTNFPCNLAACRCFPPWPISRDISCRGSSQKDVGVRLRQWNVAGLQGAGFLWWRQCVVATSNGKFFMFFICEVSHPCTWVAGHNLVKVEIDDAF